MITQSLVQQPVFSHTELLASVCREDFYQFVRRFWDVIIPEKPVWNWHIQFLCDELQRVAERVFSGKPKEYDLIINVPPGTTKSTICSVMFPAWTWTRMASIRCICGSYAHPLALDLSRKCRDIIKSERYMECFPEVELRHDQDTKSHYVNTAGGYRYAVGSGGSVTGFHGHFLIIDDPIDPLQSGSEADLRSINTWMDETLSQRKVDKAVTPLILVMQRLHQNDPTGAYLAKKRKGARHICLPAELSEDVRPKAWAKYYQNNLLDPVRLSKKVLKEAFSTLGEFGYAGQMMQRPVPRGGATFKVDMLHIGRPPETFRKIARFWDKAGTGGGGAYTVGVKMGLDRDGKYWVLDVIRGQWASHTRERMIQSAARMDGFAVPIGLEQEPGSAGQESAQNTISNLAGFKVTAARATGDKETRADAFSTQVNAGNVYLAEANWNKEYIDELRYFPKSTYKDQVDASSGCFAMIFKPKLYIGMF